MVSNVHVHMTHSNFFFLSLVVSLLLAVVEFLHVQMARATEVENHLTILNGISSK